MQKIGTIEDMLRSGDMSAADLIKLVNDTQAKLDAERAAKAQTDSKVKEARQQVVAAMLNYLEAVNVPLDAEDAKALEGLAEILFDELENSIKEAKRKADMLEKIMKDIQTSDNTEPKRKETKLSDDEILREFFKKLS